MFGDFAKNVGPHFGTIFDKNRKNATTLFHRFGFGDASPSESGFWGTWEPPGQPFKPPRSLQSSLLSLFQLPILDPFSLNMAKNATPLNARIDFGAASPSECSFWGTWSPASLRVRGSGPPFFKILEWVWSILGKISDPFEGRLCDAFHLVAYGLVGCRASRIE